MRGVWHVPGTRPSGSGTCLARDPLGKTIGLAVLETRFARKGETVEVAVGDGTVAAAVESLPIYDPEKRRPRS